MHLLYDIHMPFQAPKDHIVIIAHFNHRSLAQSNYYQYSPILQALVQTARYQADRLKKFLHQTR